MAQVPNRGRVGFYGGYLSGSFFGGNVNEAPEWEPEKYIFNNWQVTQIFLVKVPNWNQYMTAEIPNDSFVTVYFRNLTDANDKVVFKPVGTNFTYIGETEVKEDENGFYQIVLF